MAGALQELSRHKTCILMFIIIVTRTFKSTDVFTKIHVPKEGGWSLLPLKYLRLIHVLSGRTTLGKCEPQAHVSISLSRRWDPRPTLRLDCSCLRFGQLCLKKPNTGVDGQRRQNCWDWPKWKHGCWHRLSNRTERRQHRWNGLRDKLIHTHGCCVITVWQRNYLVCGGQRSSACGKAGYCKIANIASKLSKEFKNPSNSALGAWGEPPSLPWAEVSLLAAVSSFIYIYCVSSVRVYLF